MTITMEEQNALIRTAVEARMAATDPTDPKMVGYAHTPTECCDGGKCQPAPVPQRRVHPTSQAFFDLCDQLKEMHRRKSSDYGCPSGTDPLANIRRGAEFVGIPAWKGAMVRLSDKVTRLATFNATGSLSCESLEDNLFDLASYSLLALLLHREAQP